MLDTISPVERVPPEEHVVDRTVQASKSNLASARVNDLVNSRTYLEPFSGAAHALERCDGSDFASLDVTWTGSESKARLPTAMREETNWRVTDIPRAGRMSMYQKYRGGNAQRDQATRRAARPWKRQR